ncbi:hypothetical protein GCM10020295_04120 [Streptomyces cinereospinus]
MEQLGSRRLKVGRGLGPGGLAPGDDGELAPFQRVGQQLARGVLPDRFAVEDETDGLLARGGAAGDPAVVLGEVLRGHVRGERVHVAEEQLGDAAELSGQVVGRDEVLAPGHQRPGEAGVGDPDAPQDLVERDAATGELAVAAQGLLGYDQVGRGVGQQRQRVQRRGFRAHAQGLEGRFAAAEFGDRVDDGAGQVVTDLNGPGHGARTEPVRGVGQGAHRAGGLVRCVPSGRLPGWRGEPVDPVGTAGAEGSCHDAVLAVVRAARAADYRQSAMLSSTSGLAVHPCSTHSAPNTTQTRIMRMF